MKPTNPVYLGDHRLEPDAPAYECPECSHQFDEPHNLGCPECGCQFLPDPEDFDL